MMVKNKCIYHINVMSKDKTSQGRSWVVFDVQAQFCDSA